MPVLVGEPELDPVPVLDPLVWLLPVELLELALVLPVPVPDEPEEPEYDVELAEVPVELAAEVEVVPVDPPPEVAVELPEVLQAHSKQEPKPSQRDLVIDGHLVRGGGGCFSRVPLATDCGKRTELPAASGLAPPATARCRRGGGATAQPRGLDVSSL